MMKAIAILISIIILVLSENTKCDTANPLDKSHILSYTEVLSPGFSFILYPYITRRIQEYFNRMEKLITTEKPIWIYSFLQNLFLSRFYRANNKLPKDSPLAIINNLSYQDHISLYILFFSHHWNKQYELTYISSKQLEILAQISNNIHSDILQVFKQIPRILSFHNDKDIKIFPILNESNNPSMKKLYNNHLGQEYINYRITPKEVDLIMQGYRDYYLSNYDENLMEILYYSSLIKNSYKLIEEGERFHRFKKDIYKAMLDNSTGNKSSNKFTLPRDTTGVFYVFNDNNQRIPREVLENIVKLKELKIIIGIYKYIY